MAYDTVLRRPVAVKVLSDHGVEDAAFRARFAREARSAAGLSHPNIVQVFDIGEDDGRPFIVMEYVDGETLGEDAQARAAPAGRPGSSRSPARSARGSRAPTRPARAPRHQAAERARHARGTIKIADFGIAHALEQTRSHLTRAPCSARGVPRPEQARGERVTAAADIYSLGVVLYELLTGRRRIPATRCPSSSRRSARRP